MSEPQILCRMCDNRVNKAVHGLAAILLVRLVGQLPKKEKNEIRLHWCFAFYTFWLFYCLVAASTLPYQFRHNFGHLHYGAPSQPFHCKVPS